MKRLIFGIMVLAVATSVMAASSVAWEGRAAVGSSDAFPAGGKYAQSRVFSKGEIVDVYNTVSGKSVTVVITGTTDLAGVLILVSPSVAEELGITGGYDTVVRISRKNDYVGEGTLSPAVASSVPDPDNNAGEAVKNDLAYTENYKPADNTTADSDIAPVAEVAPVAQAETPTQPVVPAVQEQKPVTAYEYALLPDPQNVSPSSQQEQIPVQTQQVPPVSATTVTPIVIIQAAPATETAKAVPQTSVQPSFTMPFPELLISDYEYGKYYVQIAVFKDSSNIRNVVSKYRGKYPISIKCSDKTPNGYEVLIGPLSKDEYNAVLTKFRKDGYKDAFIKTKK